jgi:tyrosyl-tRNA synthetase
MTVEPATEALLRYTDKVVPEGELEQKLALGRPLRVKLGLDPTAPAVTLGWAVVLRKLRQFQDLGHTAVLIVGDFTAQVGDPSERSATRKRLTVAEVSGYAERLLSQFRRVLSEDNLEIRHNSEWLAELGMSEMLGLTAGATVAQMLERSDFAKRYEEGTPISVMEFLYPLLQGYDSVAVRADLELGGSDQLWNLMMGRTVQQRYGQEPQVALTVPLLVGTDGTEKMSQSLDNYIGIEEPAEEMFGKTMSIPDTAMPSWFRLAADLPPDEVKTMEAHLQTGQLHPAEAKRRLAREIVAMYWGEAAAQTAEEAFDRVFKRGEEPESMPDYTLGDDDPVHVPSLLREVFATSGREARRLIDQGAVSIDGETVGNQHVPRNNLVGRVLKVGKRRFARLVG